MSILIQGARVTFAGEGQRLSVLGDNQRVVLTGEDTDGKYALIENFNSPGLGIPLHLHQNEDETFHVLEGEVEFQLGDEKIRASAGTTVYLPRNTPHAFTIVGEANARMLIMVMPSGLEKYFEELSQLAVDPPLNMDKVMEISTRYGIELLAAPERHDR